MAINITAIELTADSVRHTLKEILHLVHTAEAMDPLRSMIGIHECIDWAKDSLRKVGKEADPELVYALLYLQRAYFELTGDRAFCMRLWSVFRKTAE